MCILFLVMLSTFAVGAEKQITLKLGKPSLKGSPKNHYILSLLEKSFAQMNVKLNITYTTETMNTKRILEELKTDGNVNLAWLAMTPSQAFDANLPHTTYPIYHGLHSKRLLMIKKSRLNDFANITSLEQLKPYIALQKQSWSDYEILKANGLNVNGELHYHGMLRALHEELADYFPRSVTAIAAEIKKQPQYNFIVEPHIMLQYNNYYYFYSNTSDKEIITLLQQGLTKLAEKGELEAHYQQFYHDVERELNLKSRQVFTLDVQ